MSIVVTCEEPARWSCGHRNKNQAGGGQACLGPSLWGHRLFLESGWTASALTCSVARASAELEPASGWTTHLRRVASCGSPFCPSYDGSRIEPHLPSPAAPLLSRGYRRWAATASLVTNRAHGAQFSRASSWAKAKAQSQDRECCSSWTQHRRAFHFPCLRPLPRGTCWQPQRPEAAVRQHFCSMHLVNTPPGRCRCCTCTAETSSAAKPLFPQFFFWIAFFLHRVFALKRA